MVIIEVDTKYGKLAGCSGKCIDGVDFFQFKGIPYAKPPVGDLRFRDPVPIEPWSGTKNAQEYGSMCAQSDPFANISGGTDDCLYLNVFTKSLESNSRLPVMVWIHGGGFLFGSGGDLFYGANLLMKKDIVLVTFNYRLGIFGFLNLDHEAAPGNQGLKDQVMALQWVKDNIANFGGNPDNVTIFGESAGGAAVHLLTISPLARGLFHKAISQSGVTLCPWASFLGEQKDVVQKICKHLGKNITDTEKIIEFLKTIEPMKLVELHDIIKHTETDSATFNLFCPGVDNKSSKPFMPVSKEIAAQEGAHVPYIIGHNNREGTLMLRGLEGIHGNANDENIIKFLHSQTLDLLKEYDLTIDDLKRLYLKSGKGFEDEDGLANMLGDLLFNYGIHKVIKTQVERSAAPTYMYRFTYDKGFTFSKAPGKNHIEGATHMDELIYLFDMKFIKELNVDPLPKGTKSYQVMEQIIELWTNFAKTSLPTPTISKLIPVYWQPVVDGTILRYLNIGENLQMEKTLNVEERFLFKKNGSPKL